MVMIEHPRGPFSMDGYLKQNLDIVHEQINKKDMDMFIIYDGYEGVGKSVKAMQDCYLIDPARFSLKNVCFTATEFKERVMAAQKGEAIQYDEAITGTFNREAIQLMNVMLIKMMAQIRQKNLFIALVLPSFYDLDKNLALWRSKALVHCYFGPGFQRGFFRFANLNKKKYLYLTGQKTYRYPIADKFWNFKGRFTNFYTVPENPYRNKKASAFMDTDFEFASARKIRSQRDSLILTLLSLGWAQEDAALCTDIFEEGLSRVAITKIAQKWRKLLPVSSIIELKSKYDQVKAQGEPDMEEKERQDK